MMGCEVIMARKIYPVTGMTIDRRYKALVSSIGGMNDYVLFLPKELVRDIAEGEKIDEADGFTCSDINKAYKQFPCADSFAAVNEHTGMEYDVYLAKAAIALMYVAKFLNVKNSMCRYGLQPKPWELNHTTFGNTGNQMFAFADVRLGSKKISADEFAIHTPCVYSEYSEEPSYKRAPGFTPYPLIIEQDITVELKALEKFILGTTMQRNIQSALVLLYKVLPQTDLEDSFLYFATILETLLTNSGEELIAKKIAVRTAAMVCDIGSEHDITFIANWIYAAYKYRCAYVHDGEMFSLEHGNYVERTQALFLLRYCVPYILETIVQKDIKSVDGIKQLVERNKDACGFTTGFDFINGELELFNE